jgi:hypothetical protein
MNPAAPKNRKFQVTSRLWDFAYTVYQEVGTAPFLPIRVREITGIPILGGRMQALIQAGIVKRTDGYKRALSIRNRVRPKYQFSDTYINYIRKQLEEEGE